MDNAEKSTLPAKLPALPDPWVSKLFSHMSALYGTRFTDLWKDCDLADVKHTWAEELASFTDNPECFGLALKSLTNENRFPPTLPEFVAICRRHYKRPMPVMLEHKLSAEDIEKNRQRVKGLAEQLARGMSA